MKTNEATVFVFIASIIVGILISMNLSFGQNNKVFLNVQDYNDAYNKRNRLYRNISSLKATYDKQQEKLEKYEYGSKNKTEVLKEVTDEISKSDILMGLTPVKGEGIKIMLNDATSASFTQQYDRLSLIHDEDLWFVINDLKNAGAEAISINGQRVVFSTYSYCAGVSIEFGGIKIVAPFYISAIGNKSILKNYLMDNNTRYKSMKLYRNIKATIDESDNIEIPAYTGNTSLKYSNIK